MDLKGLPGFPVFRILGFGDVFRIPGFMDSRCFGLGYFSEKIYFGHFSAGPGLWMCNELEKAAGFKQADYQLTFRSEMAAWQGSPSSFSNHCRLCPIMKIYQI